MITPISSHADDALLRLLSQYKGLPNLEGLLRALIAPMQDMETALTQLNTMRQLYTAEGVNLDNLGKILGLARFPGDDDATYRNKLIAQVKINTSQGQPEFVIQTFQLFTGATKIILVEGSSGDVLVESEYLPPDQATVDLLLGILDEVLPAGVRPYGIVSYDAADSFSYDGPLLGQGYGDDMVPGSGGKYPRLFVRNTFFQYDGPDSKGGGYGSTEDSLMGGLYLS